MGRSERDAADAARVTGCADGDGRAIEQLYDDYAAPCLALARSILVDEHYAEDAVQEVFLDLWRHAERFDTSRSSVRGWLLMLTHRKAVDRVRSEQLRTSSSLLPADDREDDRPGPAAQAVTALAGDRTRQALVTLPVPQREALVLAYWGGYSQREIAALTCTPIGTVKSRTHAAMRELRTALATDAPPVRAGAGAAAR